MTFTMVMILLGSMILGGFAGMGIFLLCEEKKDNEAAEEVQSRFRVLETTE